jgi:hypothetical protein
LLGLLLRPTLAWTGLGSSYAYSSWPEPQKGVVNIAKETNMRRTRLYRAFREMNPDGTPGKITEKISAKNVYAQIQEFFVNKENEIVKIIY